MLCNKHPTGVVLDNKQASNGVAFYGHLSYSESLRRCWAAGGRFIRQQSRPRRGQLSGVLWAYSRAAFYGLRDGRGWSADSFLLGLPSGTPACGSKCPSPTYHIVPFRFISPMGRSFIGQRRMGSFIGQPIGGFYRAFYWA